ncbi:MAG: cephalosporin hydroxylase family protein [Candidatus Riflebacteria bacterium]|nr:cephalosporin hydroxylase family protein [Candidatus Riflebacteria bacterium]
MKYIIDTDKKEIYSEDNGSKICSHKLYSKESFEIISQLWLKVGWNEKYPYTFSWMGRPVIQLPEDMIRTQEVIYKVKPDVILETGIAHGGSLIFYASLCKAMGKGRVIGVDIEIRKHNREAIESHELFPFITLIEGSSVAPDTVQKVKNLIGKNERVLILLDSNHTKEHVLAELEAYHTLVSPGSYIVATDGSMKDLYDVPRGKPEWKENHPTAAAQEFVASHKEYKIEVPVWPFNESALSENITHWPEAWIKKIG